MGINLPFIDFGGSWLGTQIAAARYHTCALLSNDTTPDVIKCWGYGLNGRLGYEDTQNRGDEANEMGDYLPAIDLGIGFNPIQVTAGYVSTCALSASNKIKCFGMNNYGQLGIGDTVDRGQSVGQMGDNLPFVELGTGFTPIQIEAGDYHVCALSDLGKVKCWGLNNYGQLGNGHTSNVGDGSNEMGDSLHVVDLGSNLNVTQITAGGRHTCSLFTIGSIKCWGYGVYGQLGNGNTNNVGDDPDEMGGYLPFVDLGIRFAGAVVEVKEGYSHTCATSSSHEVKCWGLGSYGRLGSGNTANIGDGPNEMGNYLPIVDLDFPTINPSASPTDDPSNAPTDNPSNQPSNPSTAPTDFPTINPSTPTFHPSHDPSTPPTDDPSISPTNNPTATPTQQPSAPTTNPSTSPTDDPSNQPSVPPTPSPTRHFASQSFKYESGFSTVSGDGLDAYSVSVDAQIVTLYWDTIMFQCTVTPIAAGQYYGC
eukprot:178301_1